MLAAANIIVNTAHTGYISENIIANVKYTQSFLFTLLPLPSVPNLAK